MKRVPVALVALATAAVAAPASAEDPAPGYWWVVRDGAGACAATIAGRSPGEMLTLVIGDGPPRFEITRRRPMRRGLSGAVVIDGHAFGFTPAYDAQRTTLTVPDDAGAITRTLRNAASLSISVDGQAVFDLDASVTGVRRMIDGTAACARGETGWWDAPGRRAAPGGSLNDELELGRPF